MISASNCQTPYKKLTRIVKAPNIGSSKIPAIFALFHLFVILKELLLVNFVFAAVSQIKTSSEYIFFCMKFDSSIG